MPGRVWERLFEVALEQYGYVTTEDAREADVNPVLLPQMAQRDRLEKVGHGIYRFPEVPVSELDSYMLATLWPKGRGVISHDSALELHQLCDINPSKIHVTVLADPADYRPRREGGDLFIEHYDDLDDAELDWHEGIRIVTEAVAIRQGIASNVPGYLLRQAIETARATGRITPDEETELRENLMKTNS